MNLTHLILAGDVRPQFIPCQRDVRPNVDASMMWQESQNLTFTS